MITIQLAYSSKNSLKSRRLTIADTRTGHRELVSSSIVSMSAKHVIGYSACPLFPFNHELRKN